MLEPSWVGRRITVRRVLRHSPAAPRLGDVVGDLVALDAEHAVVEARTGPVEIRLSDIAAAKLAPPSTRDELDLEAVVLRGWRAAETTQLGSWVLRANEGFTNRANSALPLGQPGTTIAEAIEAVQAWYAERGLPARFQLPVEGRRLLDAELGERGWLPSYETHVMTTRLDLHRPEPSTPIEVLATTEPDDAWLEVCRGGSTPPDVARALLTRHDTVIFMQVRETNRTVAIGRGTVDDGWLGVTAVEVVPDRRRHGLARAIMSSLHEWGRAAGARRAHLAVTTDNAPGVDLYESLGYRTHHDYRFRTEPGSSGQP